MAIYSLDQLKADVEKTYATLSITVGEDDKIDLPNILRIGDKAKRAKIMDLLDELDPSPVEGEEELSQVDQLEKTVAAARGALHLAAGKRGDDLIALIGEDDGLAMSILSKWTDGTQVGEASSSSD